MSVWELMYSIPISKHREYTFYTLHTLLVFEVQLLLPFWVVDAADQLTFLKFLLRDFVRDAVRNATHSGFRVFDTGEQKHRLFITPLYNAEVIITRIILHATEGVFVRAKNIALINLPTALVEEAGELADGIRGNFVGDVSIQHTFLLSILDNVGVTILLVEESTNPFLIIKAFSLKLNCSHYSLYFR